jgi:S-adenosylmethionine decarboxylase
MSKQALVAAAKRVREPRAPLSAESANVKSGEVVILADYKDHFIVEGNISFAGRHLIIDLWDADNLDNRDVIERALIDAVKEANATLLHIHLHTFTDGGGVSGVAVLAESHISVHTWPEKRYAAFDVFMCGDAVPRKALGVFKAAFNPGRTIVAEHKRGVHLVGSK